MINKQYKARVWVERPASEPGRVTQSNSVDDLYRKSYEEEDHRISYEGGPYGAIKACSAHASRFFDCSRGFGCDIPILGVKLKRPTYDLCTAESIGETGSHRRYYTVAGGRVEHHAPSESEVQNAINDLKVSVASDPVKIGKDYMQSLLELRDMRRTCETMARLASFYRSAIINGLNKGRIARLPKWQQMRLKNFWNGSCAAAADGYLGYVFGLEPTLRDLYDMFDDTLRHKWRKPHKRQYKGGQPVRAARTLDGPWEMKRYANVYHGSARIFVGTDWPARGEEKIVDVDFGQFLNSMGLSDDRHSNAWPIEATTNHVVEHRDLLAFARVLTPLDYEQDSPLKLGMENPLSQGWQLLPFSFAVDWFANIGKWLKQQDKLARAQKAGFNLDPLVGIWLSDRRKTETYAYNVSCAVTATSLTNIKVFGGWYPGFEVDCNYTITRDCFPTKIQEDIIYSRNKIADEVRFAPLQVRGIRDQGMFQAGAVASLAIQNCEGLRNAFYRHAQPW